MGVGGNDLFMLILVKVSFFVGEEVGMFRVYILNSYGFRSGFRFL